MNRTVLRPLKFSTLLFTRAIGLDALLARSSWRRDRVLILGYHGVSINREHDWNPDLYVSQDMFIRRLELLKKARCAVLPLDEALYRMAKGTLPARTVVITFDDGLFDFHQRAMPVLKGFGFPATVYLTSFYVNAANPVFLLGCSYLLWKHRERLLPFLPFHHRSTNFKLGTDAERQTVVQAIFQWLESVRPTAELQQQALRQMAGQLGDDLSELSERRILHLMNATEVGEASEAGFSIQLHTHRHRAPLEKDLFAREIHQNRECIKGWTGHSARHFCYPSGEVNSKFFPWLQQQGVQSGVTCVPGLVSTKDHPLLLPRLVDSSGMSELEFESWLAGSGALLRAARGRNRGWQRDRLITAAWHATIPGLGIQP